MKLEQPIRLSKDVTFLATERCCEKGRGPLAKFNFENLQADQYAKCTKITCSNRATGALQLVIEITESPVTRAGKSTWLL